MWFIGVEVEQGTSAPPPKKNPGSAPVSVSLGAISTPKRNWRQCLCKSLGWQTKSIMLLYFLEWSILLSYILNLTLSYITLTPKVKIWTRISLNHNTYCSNLLLLFFSSLNGHGKTPQNLDVSVMFSIKRPKSLVLPIASESCLQCLMLGHGIVYLLQ